jgi:anti-sigma regulatory factor (Ser/Thr protein kinase)
VSFRRSLHRTWCGVASLPVLRRWLRTNVPAGVDPADAELVCTELVTNAIEHGGGARAVRITVDSRQVCVEVDDDEADVLPTTAHPGSGCSGAAAS